jgi:ABC-2 type transport system permease protein
MRYIRLYLCFLRFSAGRSMEFRLDFFFRIVMDFAYYGVALGFFHLLYQHTPTVAGWDLHQARLFVAGYIVIDAVHMTLFSNNLWILPSLVNKGDLDYYLARPVSSLFFLSLRDFAFNSFLNLLFALGILVWAIASYPAPLGAAHIAFFGLLLLGGSFLYYCVHMLTILPVFWTQSGQVLTSLFYNVTRFMERPDRIYRGFTRLLFTVVLPFGVMASFPARLLLEPFDVGILLHFLVVVTVFFGIVVWVWRAGLRTYSSASS